MFRNKKNNAIGVIGLGRFGMALAKRLCELGKEVVAVDQNECKIKEINAHTEYAFVVDNLNKETLEETGIQNCEVVIICIGEKIDVCILAALNVVSLGVPKVIAKAISYEQGCVLEKIGAEVVYPEHDMAMNLAKRIVSNSVLDHISLNSEIEISEFKIKDKLLGQTVDQSHIRQKYGLNIIAIEHGSDIITEISSDYVFKQEDIIVVIGKKKNIQLFVEE